MVRRVVTGDRDGKAVIVSDANLEFKPLASTPPGTEFFRLWGDDCAPALPSDGVQPALGEYFPPDGGYRFLLITFPPANSQVGPIADMKSALAEFEAAMPGFSRTVDPDRPAMHQSDTVDFDVILAGELWLELDDGQEVQLKAGDCVIQNGTRHAWHNRSEQPCRMLSAAIGGRRA